MPVRQVPTDLAGRVADAAAEVFARQGYDAAKIEDIAEAAGVARATLYYYFASKDDLLEHALRRSIDEVAEAVAEAQASAADAREGLEAVVRAYVRQASLRPDRWTILFAELGRIQQRLPILAAGIAGAFLVPVAQLLEQGMKDKSFRKVDVTATPSALFGALSITTLHYLVVEGSFPEKRVADELVAFCLAAVSK